MTASPPEPPGPEDEGVGWRVPGSIGAPFAVQSLSGTAAPLLAGFSVTLAALIVQAPEKFRISGVALVLAALAITLLLSCVQCGFWARHFYAAPDETIQWWSTYPADPERQAKVHEEQRRNYPRYLMWANLARRTYSAGIVLVYLALAAAMVPREDSPDYRFRAAAAGLLLVAAIGEVAWILSSRYLARANHGPTGPRP